MLLVPTGHGVAYCVWQWLEFLCGLDWYQSYSSDLFVLSTGIVPTRALTSSPEFKSQFSCWGQLPDDTACTVMGSQSCCLPDDTCQHSVPIDRGAWCLSMLWTGLHLG